jgi:monoamine oxidase
LNDDTINGRRIWFGGSEASEDWTGMIEGAVMNGTEIGKKIANFP